MSGRRYLWGKAGSATALSANDTRSSSGATEPMAGWCIGYEDSSSFHFQIEDELPLYASLVFISEGFFSHSRDFMLNFVFVPAGSQQHARDWEQLATRSTASPFVHSVVWAQERSRPLDRWCRVLNERGELVAGVVVAIDRSRKLPWVQLARIPQATALLSQSNVDDIKSFVRILLNEAPRLVQLTVQAYDVLSPALHTQKQRLREAGFSEDVQARHYQRTLLLPLDGSLDELRTRLSASARRNVRQVAENGFAVRAITSVADADRIAWLLRASHHRTGAEAAGADSASMIRAAANDPDTSVMLGIFHPNRPSTESLVGFAQGTLAPGAATYAVAGTERASDIGRTPLSYSLVWELLEWARHRGAQWFDFGGVTDRAETVNPLSGISEFKRKFGGTDSVVASEYSVITNPPQQRLLSMSATVVQRLRGAG